MICYLLISINLFMIPSAVAIQSRQKDKKNNSSSTSNHQVVKIGPSILKKYYETGGQRYKQVALFPLFSFRKKPTKQEISSSQPSETSFVSWIKETEDFLISYHLLNPKTLYFEFYHKQQKTIMIRLAIANQHLSTQAKNEFQDVAGLCQKLQNSETLLYLSPSGQLVARLKEVGQAVNTANTQKRRKTRLQKLQQLYRQKIAAARQALREKERSSAEEVGLLLAVEQNQSNSGKEALKNLQILIQKSRYLPETSPEVKGVMQLWKRRLHSALIGNSIEQLHLALSICEKYWLRHDLLAQDELMNVMRQRMGRLIDSGQWMLE